MHELISIPQWKVQDLNALPVLMDSDGSLGHGVLQGPGADRGATAGKFQPESHEGSLAKTALYTVASFHKAYSFEHVVC